MTVTGVTMCYWRVFCSGLGFKVDITGECILRCDCPRKGNCEVLEGKTKIWPWKPTKRPELLGREPRFKRRHHQVVPGKTVSHASQYCICMGTLGTVVGLSTQVQISWCPD